ncbi:terpene synthase family protein [Micromonospora echinofusca]|uniref:Terpene synthase n=1 Tax=Micromonospora echinofusca TaxID=47858 RepID=A0ABS3VNI8_MICEH|nr:terpene synthase [Micromonospora echinofusca]MBO4206051.1 terpene synthase [Micromonospora echinofusca]
MRGLAVAALTMPPFPSRVHAEASGAGVESARWAAEFGLVTTTATARRLAQASPAELAGRACPDADSHRLRLLTDLVTWLFAFDDNCDDDGLGADPAQLSPLVVHLLDVLDLLGGPTPAGSLGAAGPFGAALHDLCRRAREVAPPALLLRFAGQLRDYLLALLWEAANRERDRVPGVAEYVRMRRFTGAVQPSFTLTDLAHGAFPVSGRLADPRLTALDTVAADLVCWCNDAFSYDKEHRLSRDGHNLTVAIARETGQDEQAALLATAERFNAGLRRYAELESVLLADGDPAVDRFAAARRCWIRGTYDWSLHAARYR